MRLIKLLLLSLGCSIALVSGAQVNKEVLKVARLMSGDFSSEQQSKEDTSYFDIRLSIIPIWKDRKDAAWLYVEQAISSKMDNPYRQRIYRLTQTADGSYESAVFTLNSPLRFAGKVELVEKLGPDSLELRQGCSVFLKQISKNLYEGGTADKTCPSDMRGAAYASSIVSIRRKMLVSWDRGFDREGNQVWGAEKAGYKFIKLRKR